MLPLLMPGLPVEPSDPDKRRETLNWLLAQLAREQVTQPQTIEIKQQNILHGAKYQALEPDQR